MAQLASTTRKQQFKLTTTLRRKYVKLDKQEEKKQDLLFTSLNHEHELIANTDCPDLVQLEGAAVSTSTLIVDCSPIRYNQ